MIMILNANERWDVALENAKVFYPPSTSFLPPFLLWNLVFHMLEFDFQQTSYVKMGGKNLVRGVKNFCILTYEHSALICTKNHYHILKTHENRYRWNTMILMVKTKQKMKIEIFEKFNFDFRKKKFSILFAFDSYLFLRVFKIWC